MGFGVEIRNDDNKILINQAFNNLCLSRKIKASDLPIVTASGGWLMGSFRVRQITMQADEVLAACGRSQGQSYCPYGISYGFSGAGNGLYGGITETHMIQAYPIQRLLPTICTYTHSNEALI